MLMLMVAWFAVGFDWVCDSYLVPSLFRQIIGRQPVEEMGLFISELLPWLVCLIVIPVFGMIRLCQWRRRIYGQDRVSIVRTLLRLIWIYLWRTFFWVLFIPCLIGFLRICYLGLFVWL